MAGILIFVGNLLIGLDDAFGQAANGANDATIDEEYGEFIQGFRAKLVGEDFHFLIQRPFVVIGDEDKEVVQRRAESTVKWAVEHLKELYFKEDPDRIIGIWLFKDKESYDSHCESLFGLKPTTPFGFYSSAKKALIMNISTGGGTLVHEIVHPYIAANFPDCPSWFNEGLASLYEQSVERDNRICGLTNWRLRGLQAAIEGKRLSSFPDLLKTTKREFYADATGTNYAQARYLCYYLQEHGKLVDFYHRFRENVKTDSTGMETLGALLEIDDWETFQADWERFVMKLKF